MSLTSHGKLGSIEPKMNIAETRSVGALILRFGLNLGAWLHDLRMLLSGGAATCTLVHPVHLQILRWKSLVA
ncbi:hypothetical protein GSI_01759 [Ganoderma sinense ZZ0214-1]|uniref:Uncharacterized protein n=1 Tax=Ganoderma sinense ZZ0214-1 TaxID=1077348 RepID=A0A2G8SQQ6_9APHY|nr:hypothetical protein GSI_01759 [Ganoderma sinense ZZ0214-1]